MKLPKRSKGRQSAAELERYDLECREFAQAILQIKARLDFPVSARGWCYILEEYGLLKGDFGLAQSLICDLRKNGLLPLDICSEDQARSWECVGYTHEENPSEYVDNLIRRLEYQANYYTPIDFWEDQPYYIECLVEKIDLLGLFKPVCQQYHIPIANGRGQADLNCRASMMERFAQREAQGKIPVLLYCGDFDPFGLVISDSLRGNLSALTPAVGWSPDNLIIDRFGLNADFIEANSLTWIDNLETGSGKRLDDPGHRCHKSIQEYIALYGARKVEANALVVRPQAGRQLIRDAINKYVTPDAVEVYQTRSASAQNEVRSLIQQFLGVTREN